MLVKFKKDHVSGFKENDVKKVNDVHGARLIAEGYVDEINENEYSTGLKRQQERKAEDSKARKAFIAQAAKAGISKADKCKDCQDKGEDCPECDEKKK
jgi:hypothetical protein